MNGIKTQSAIVFAIKVLSAGLAMLVNMFITNNLNIKDVGVYFLMSSVVLFINPIAVWGLNNYTLKHTAIYTSTNTNNIVVNTMLMRCLLSSAAVSFTIVCMLILLYNDVNKYILDGNVSFKTYAYLLFSVPFFSLGTIICHALQGGGGIKLSMFISGPLIQILLLFLSFSLTADNVDKLSLCYFISTLGFFIISFSFWLFYYGVEIKKTTLELSNIYYENTSLMLIQLLGVIYLSLSQVLLGATGNVTDVAKLAICIKISMLLSFVLQAVNKVVAPNFSALFYKGEIIKLKQLVKTSTRILITACMPIVVLFFFFSKEILTMFGEEYRDASWMLMVLIASQVVNICTGTVSYLLMMTGYEKSHRNNVVISSGISLIIGMISIKYIGVYGALFMVCFSLICTNVLSWIMVKRKLGINTLDIF
ncbi:lipopolysaccharide biosynthesis protein [Aeromonas caviae]|uniref:lipopolysaccharide biosynthesis protein n=1 Tax=Aeromonas caviae TaxID=648 RepID=UPI0029DAA252|nr:hypothetical protein [Aeromonas caviae]MDX7949433.1 hypothetical protein [Aeromonas caviae]